MQSRRVASGPRLQIYIHLFLVITCHVLFVNLSISLCCVVEELVAPQVSLVSWLPRGWEREERGEGGGGSGKVILLGLSSPPKSGQWAQQAH